MEVNYETLERMLNKGRAASRSVRGPSDHGFIHSIYFQDPNGYVVELAAPTAEDSKQFDPEQARKRLDEWSTR